MNLRRALRNPILLHGQRQSARLGRVPWFFLAIGLALTFMVASVGGLAAETTSAASVGSSIHGGVFNVALFLIAVAGAGVAAQSLSSEHGNRTWEALVLTGLTPRQIVFGKFLGSYGVVALWIVALAPLASMAFVFGGVSALEVLASLLFLAAVGAVAVLFGLAVTALVPGQGTAISVLLVLCITPVWQSMFAAAGAVLVADMWPSLAVPSAAWWSAVVTRAPLDANYLFFGWLTPIAGFGLTGWWLYEQAVAATTEWGRDRMHGVKRALYITPILLSVIVAIMQWAGSSETVTTAASWTGVVSLLMLVPVGLVLLAEDDLYPLRRARHELATAGSLRRFMGPAVTRACLTFAVICLSCSAVLVVSAQICALGHGWSTSHIEPLALLLLSLGPFLFGAGATVVLLRARGMTPWPARVVTFAIGALLAIGPTVLATLVEGALSSSGSAALVMAPSPFYYTRMIRSLDAGGAEHYGDVLWGILAALLYLTVSIAMYVAAAQRARHRRDVEVLHFAEVDRKLAEEDAWVASQAGATP